MGKAAYPPRGRAAAPAKALVAGFLTAAMTTASCSPAGGPSPADEWVTECPSNAFCFARPADLVLQPGQAIDSLAARYQGPNLALSFDLGRYGTSLAHLKQPTEQAMNIDGRPARMLSAGKEVVLAVPRVRETQAIAVQFTMILRFEGDVSLPLARRIFASIRFAPLR